MKTKSLAEKAINMLALSRRKGESIILNDYHINILSVTSQAVEIVVSTERGNISETRRVTLAKSESTELDSGKAVITVLDLPGANDAETKVKLGIETRGDASEHQSNAFTRSATRQWWKRSNPAQQTGQADPSAQQARQAESLAHIAVDFGPGFTQDEIESCLEYVSEIYRSHGGAGLKIVGSHAFNPDEAGLPHVN